MTENSYPDYVEQLNPQQRAAVLHQGSPLLILAGAGSGKTRVITTKIAYSLDVFRVNPASILAVTFTNKAAGEMRDRLAGLTSNAEGVMIRTFHSFGAWLLRRYGKTLAVNQNFLIYDENDASALLKSGLKDQYEPKDCAAFFNHIMRAKDLCLGPSDDLSMVSHDSRFAKIYREYETHLRKTGNLDFGDLIMQSVLLLRCDASVRERVQKRFQMILVDEYQDSNRAQYELLQELTGADTSLCVVGDDDQSIYGFRGAQVENILNFPTHFSGTTIIKLEENYRSTKSILAAASTVVANNTRRMGKTLMTRNADGEPIRLIFFQSHHDEALFAANLIEENPGNQTAIMYRMNYQSRAFEEIFTRRRIPYILIGSVRFYEREEIKDVLAWLGFIVNPHDEIALRRIINKPARGIGEQTCAQIFSNLEDRTVDLIAHITEKLTLLSTRAKSAVEKFLGLTMELRDLLSKTPLARFIDEIAVRSGLAAFHETRDSHDQTMRLKNLEELVNAAVACGTGESAATAFLENALLVNPEYGDKSKSCVSLITLHNTKGLEFDRVMITGCEEGVFPVASGGDSDHDIEEERRLFYVGLTRARQQLILSSSRTRFLYGATINSQPSRFIREIPENLVTVTDYTRRLPRHTAQDRFPRGMRVYSDDYGTGHVLQSSITDDDEVVTVRFDSGRIVPIIVKYHDLVKIED